MKKKTYTCPEMHLVELDANDIIATSGNKAQGTLTNAGWDEGDED